MYQTPTHACSDYYWDWLINIILYSMSSYGTHQEVRDSIYMFTLPQLTDCGDRKETLYSTKLASLC